MKKLVIVIACLMLSSVAFSKTKPNCPKKGMIEVSCADIEGAQRDFICVKGELKEGKKDTMCKTEKKVSKQMKRKKMAKKGA